MYEVKESDITETDIARLYVLQGKRRCYPVAIFTSEDDADATRKVCRVRLGSPDRNAEHRLKIHSDGHVCFEINISSNAKNCYVNGGIGTITFGFAHQLPDTEIIPQHRDTFGNLIEIGAHVLTPSPTNKRVDISRVVSMDAISVTTQADIPLRRGNVQWYISDITHLILVTNHMVDDVVMRKMQVGK